MAFALVNPAPERSEESTCIHHVQRMCNDANSLVVQLLAAWSPINSSTHCRWGVGSVADPSSDPSMGFHKPWDAQLDAP